jgi:Flp pilus assembly protein TadG
MIDRASSLDRRERGQILVLFVLGLVVLALMVGLVVDGGSAFLNRRDGQNAADLAAMAGTKKIADFYTKTPNTIASVDVFNAINTSATTNNCSASGATPCTWTASYVDKNETSVGAVTNSGSIPSGAQGVIVHVSRTPRTYFLGVIGQSTWSVATDATALTTKQPGAPGGQLLPIATNPPQTYVPGQTYTITDLSNGPGNFGWISWFGGNASGTLSTSICTPNNPAMTFPVWIPGEPGGHNSNQVRDCLQGWVDSGATVLIPVFDQCTNCNGNNASYHIIGLAAFVITGFVQPAIDQINGRFVGYFGPPQLPGVGGSYGGPPSPGDPTVFIGLIR